MIWITTYITLPRNIFAIASSQEHVTRDNLVHDRIHELTLLLSATLQSQAKRSVW